MKEKISSYKQGQVDLINKIKSDLLKITDSDAKDSDILFDLLMLLKTLKPI